MVEAAGVEPASHGKRTSRDYMLSQVRVFSRAIKT